MAQSRRSLAHGCGRGALVVSGSMAQLASVPGVEPWNCPLLAYSLAQKPSQCPPSGAGRTLFSLASLLGGSLHRGFKGQNIRTDQVGWEEVRPAGHQVASENCAPGRPEVVVGIRSAFHGLPHSAASGPGQLHPGFCSLLQCAWPEGSLHGHHCLPPPQPCVHVYQPSPSGGSQVPTPHSGTLLTLEVSMLVMPILQRRRPRVRLE